MKMHQCNKFFFFFVMVGLLLCSVVFADSAERPPTKSEKEFYHSVMSTFIKAAPSKPEGWDQIDFFHDEELQRVTTGLEHLPFRVAYFIGWQDTPAINAGQEKLSVEIMKMSKENITDKSVEDLQKRVTPHDVKVRVDLQANFLSLCITGKINPAPAIAGGLTYRIDSKYDSDGVWVEGATYIFLGKGWRLDTSSGTYMNFTPNKSTPSLTVQNIAVKITADPNRVQTLVQQIDWDALKNMIKN
jgi:hypothetical protein